MLQQNIALKELGYGLSVRWHIELFPDQVEILIQFIAPFELQKSYMQVIEQ